jgi:hypothetical protein
LAHTQAHVTREVASILSLDYELASVTHLDETTSLLVVVLAILTQQAASTSF